MAGMKHVVLFSGGLSSAYVAYLVLQEQKKEDVVLLHTPTLSELPDADKFRYEVARYLKVDFYLGAPMEQKDGLLTGEQCGIVPYQKDKIKN